MSRFLLSGGLLTGLLLADDFFELHEIVFPSYLQIPEHLTYAFYGVLVCALLVIFLKFILQTDYVILGVAFVFLGGSMLSDAFQPHVEPLLGEWRILAEDGLKFLGITAWFGYFSRSCFAAVSGTLQEKRWR